VKEEEERTMNRSRKLKEGLWKKERKQESRWKRRRKILENRE
jgi:hypothetical protein